MPLVKFTTDKIVRRLCWVAVWTIFFDDFNTLLGQPASFWQHPETADEFNRLTHYFISQGWLAYSLEQLAYAAGAFLLASILPRRCALVMLFALILGHFDGASSWLAHRWHFGTTGMVIYAILLAAIVVWSAFPAPGKPNAGSDLQKP